MEIAILALGCFWGPEIRFSKLEGIVKTEVGYCGGNNKDTNYKEVCTGKQIMQKLLNWNLIQILFLMKKF